MIADQTSQLSAYVDPRTGLPNRNAFYRDGEPLLAGNDGRHRPVSLLALDIGGIETILRIFGPSERDALIQQIGNRVHVAARAGVGPYHIGPGRFAVFLPDTDPAKAATVTRRLLESVDRPFNINGIPYRLQSTASISHYPDHANTLPELARTAAVALYQASGHTTRVATYDAEADTREQHRFLLLTELTSALEAIAPVRLAFQPLVDLQTGRCIGAEALCRWQHPTRGLILPDEFIPLVENTDFIVPLTETVVAQAATALARWQDGGSHMRMAINFSPAMFQYPEAVTGMINRLLNRDIDPATIEFEITETGIMTNRHKAAQILGDIRKLGFRIAVDDFGTGHSGLSYLADLPADTLKLDRSLLDMSSININNEAIGRAMTTLAHELGIHTVVAEGIETAEQFHRAQAWGCDLAQGFHIARPMFERAFTSWVTASAD